MMHPYKLIGLPYRLGASPERHGAADCLTLAIATLTWHGVPTPKAERSWYRRLRKGDTDVFKDELEKWGKLIESPKIGTVALCQSTFGLGMASYFEEGWIHFSGSVANWSPIGALQVIAFYCPMK